jgi:ATP-dependent Lhr-like helicase
MRAALKRIRMNEIVLKVLDKPSPFCFPIMVERLRSKLTTESIEDQVNRLISDLEGKKASKAIENKTRKKTKVNSVS